MTPEHDVVIVGYGPVGAMLALLLKQQGIRCLIIEPDREILAFPRAAHFDDEVIRLYHTVGLGHLADDMETPTRYQYFDKNWKPFLARLFPQGISDQGTRHDFMFFQPDVEAEMRSHLMEGDCAPQLAFGERVTHINQSVDHVSVETIDSAGERRTYDAHYVVGCDGASSTVRKAMGSPFEQLAPSHQWYIVDVKLNGTVDPGLDQWEFCSPDRIVTYIPLSGPYRRFEFDVKAGESDADLGTLDRTWSLLSPWLKPGDANILRNDIYRFHSLLAAKWRDRRVFIAGDAAHLMTPKLGQGLCTGMRDAANLAWKLEAALRSTGGEDLLDSYETERKGAARQYIEISAYMVEQIVTMAGGNDRGAEPVVEEIVAPRQKLGDDASRAHDSLLGTLSRQPILENGARMDDIIGYRHCLIVLPELLLSIPPDVLDFLEARHAVVLPAEDEALSRWLTEIGRVAILIRPDRYIAWTAPTEADLVTLSFGAQSEAAH